MVSGATCSGSPGDVGSCVAGGFAGADDGGAVAVGVGVADGLPVAVGLAVVVGVTVGAAELLVGDDVVACVVVAAAELPVGAGAGGPKQPESENRAQSPKTLNAVSLGLVMVPPWVRSPTVRDLPSKYAGAALHNRDLSPTPRQAPTGRMGGQAPRRN
ncbi:hypothetical protein JOE40_000022 [Arthrobacter sp. PvP102]|uniref:hypothetical protein n=1 Tax=unclassified Arthrobacter TaxID=235627 RepID=UPI001AE4DE42|nr:MULTISPECIES: hypothetical protein [unclassified Arthrobacter]MBP1234555.1 hypothetical protein [Arthrobacter sp. PvP103]MBP1235513.1 hypothetical protein [Arthrobacter sp. PvP102]